MELMRRVPKFQCNLLLRLVIEIESLFQSDAEFMESSLAMMPTRCIEEDGLRGRSMPRPETSVTSSKLLTGPAAETMTMGPPMLLRGRGVG